MPRELTDKESLQLESWLNDNGIQMCKINHDLSDAVAVANLIQKFYPKLIDMDNYPTCDSVQAKLKNWEHLNEKVLSKLSLYRTQLTLDRLAKGTPGVVQLLLYDLMNAKEVETAKREKEFADYTDQSKIMMVVLHRKVNGVFVPQTEKMIMYSIYEWTLHELQSKQLELQEAKMRIAELESELERLQKISEKGAELGSALARLQKTSQNSAELGSALARLQKPSENSAELGSALVRFQKTSEKGAEVEQTPKSSSIAKRESKISKNGAQLERKIWR